MIISETNCRYQRQVLLPEIGLEGQEKLAGSTVLVVGAGGLGAPVLQYLAAAGVGSIVVLDGDTVSETNLNRQVLYGDRDIGRPKAACADERLRQLNREVAISAMSKHLTTENAPEMLKGVDALALCTDSIESRLIANRACMKAGLPYVNGAVARFSGTVMTVVPGETPCYECVHGSPKQSDETIPILGAMAGWVGCAEALAVIRLLLGISDPSRGSILFLDGAEMTVEQIPIAKSPGCPCCNV